MCNQQSQLASTIGLACVLVSLTLGCATSTATNETRDTGTNVTDDSDLRHATTDVITSRRNTLDALSAWNQSEMDKLRELRDTGKVDSQTWIAIQANFRNAQDHLANAHGAIHDQTRVVTYIGYISDAVRDNTAIRRRLSSE